LKNRLYLTCLVCDMILLNMVALVTLINFVYVF